MYAPESSVPKHEFQVTLREALQGLLLGGDAYLSNPTFQNDTVSDSRGRLLGDYLCDLLNRTRLSPSDLAELRDEILDAMVKLRQAEHQRSADMLTDLLVELHIDLRQAQGVDLRATSFFPVRHLHRRS